MSQIQEEHPPVSGLEQKESHVHADAVRMQPLIHELLASMDEAMMIIDHDGRIRGWSRGAHHLLGYRAVEVLGKPVTVLAPASRQRELAAALAGLRTGGDGAQLHVPLADSDGEEHPFEVRAQAMRHEDGQLILARLAAQNGREPDFDLSAQQMREVWALLESVPVVFAHIGRDRRVRYVNRSAIRMTPHHRTDVIGRHLREIFGDGMYEHLRPQIDLVLSGQECSSEITLPHRDGSDRHFLRHLYPDVAPDGSVRGYFSVLVDVTEAKVTQESLLRREQSLRSTLVREINHRVKNSLQGLIGIMRLYDPHETNPAALIDECVSKLMAVAVAFGLASKHGEARILLCDMVRDIAHSVSELTHRSISVDILPHVAEMPIPLSEAHAVNISIVINEIVFNAVKHGAVAPGSPDVRISVDRDGSTAFVRVANPGQLPPDFSFAAGTGLGTGLSLVRVLVPPESCDLTITTEPEGTVAVLRLAPPVLA
jgi:PAS domain S-box-containing protein